MGGWIINAEKKHFCHDGKDGSCFDKYCNIKKEAQCQDTMVKRRRNLWVRKRKWIRKKRKVKNNAR